MQLSPGLKSIIENSLYIYATRLLNQVLRFAYIFVLARIFTTEEYGILAFGNAWYQALLPFAGLGMGAYLAVEVGKKDAGLEQTLGVVFACRMLALVLLTAISFVLAYVDSANSQHFWILFSFSFALFGRGLILWTTHVFQAYESSKLVLKAEKRFRPVELATGLLIAWLTREPLWVAVSHALFILIQGVYCLSLVSRHIRSIRPIWHVRDMFTRVSLTAPLALATPISQLMLQGPAVILKFMGAGLAGVANMSLAMQGFLIFSSWIMAFGYSAIPVLSRNKNDASNVRRYVTETIRLSVLIGLPVGIGGLALLEFVYLAALGEKYLDAAQSAGLLLFALMPAMVKNLLRGVLVSNDHRKTVLFSDVMSVATLVACCYVFYPSLGLKGVAIGLFAGFTMGAIITVLKLVRMGLYPTSAILVKCFSVSSVVLVTYFVCSGYVGLSSLLTACAMGISYLVTVISLKVISISEVKTLTAKLRRT